MKAGEIVDVDHYIMGFPDEIQQLLQQIRTTIKQAAPDSLEMIAYQMPAYKYQGMLVYFAGYKHHIGFYPTPNAIAAFKDELSVYKNAKGSVQFPLDQTLPLDLVTRIVKFRVQENLEKEALKKTKKKKD